MSHLKFTSCFIVLAVACSLLLSWTPCCLASGDFNGDGKDDIITFVRDSEQNDVRGDVFVALSNGSKFGGGQRWHDWFCIGHEIPGVGDFNGDGRDDIIIFVRNAKTDSGRGDVYVALSNGSTFVNAGTWHTFSCINTEIPAIGDFNGDGRDDIATFTRNASSGDVFVSLSTGSSFSGTGVKWHNFFCINSEIPAVGDFNGDGKDDIVSFTRETYSGDGRGDVYVSLSNGSGFSGTGAKWHNFFCIHNEIPIVGDFNGDGKDDIAAFSRSGSTRGNIYVALSTGHSFSGTGQIWKDWSGAVNYIPDTGDFNGDGKDDFACFLHMVHTGSYHDDWTGDAEVALSTGTKFGSTNVWNGWFCIKDEVPTMFTALFPYYMFAERFENTSKYFGAYTSDEEDRFPGYCSGFISEFDEGWHNSQYYWGECAMLGSQHLRYVDNVDIAFLAGHGSPSSITLCDGACGLTNLALGSWSSHSRRGDLEYIAFESCKVTRLNNGWGARWRSGPFKKGMFSGLHVACGFHNNHQYTPCFSLGDEFAENLEDNFSVRWAWMEATDDEDDYIVGHTNYGSTIYVRPHKYEKIGGYRNRDRWYHDSDYKLQAQRWK